MRTSLYVIVTLAATILLLSSTYLHPFMTLEEKGMKGPVLSVTHNFERHMSEAREIQFHRFDKSGRLVEVRNFLPQYFVELDSIALKVTGEHTTMKKWINPKYRGLDTNKFVFSHNIVYKYDNHGNMILSELLGEDGYPEWKRLFGYDVMDSLVSELSYHYDTLGQANDSLRTNYDYFTNGNIQLKTQITSQTSSDTSSVFRTERVLNENRRIVISRVFSNDMDTVPASESHLLKTYTYKNDSLLETALQFIVDAIDTVKSYEEYRTYNSRGQLTSKSETHFIGGKKSDTVTHMFTYHSGTEVLYKRQTLKEKHMFGDGVTFEAAYHNRHGDLTKCNIYEEGDTSIYTSRYIYDDHQNWTELIWAENGVELDTLKRLITYYE